MVVSAYVVHLMSRFPSLARKLKLRLLKITEKIPMMRGEGLLLIQIAGERASILNASSFETDML